MVNVKSKIKTNLKYLYCVSDQDLNKYLKVYNNPVSRFNNNEAPAVTHPVILSPAYSKLLYAKSVKDLFYGANFYGRENDQIIIIGCSLAKYDPYIRQWIFNIIQQYYGMNHSKKISVINSANSFKMKRDMKENYSYLDKNRIAFTFDGFTKKSLFNCLK